jgi:hypothetical protein
LKNENKSLGSHRTVVMKLLHSLFGMAGRKKRALAGLAMSNLTSITFEDAEESRREDAT